MTTDQRKVQLGIGVDATEARAGFQDVKDAARDMAQGVAQAGQEAAKGVDGIGAGTGAAAQKVEQSTRSITDSIKRVSAAADDAARASMTWNDFVKQGMGPLMKQFSDEGATKAEAHTRAIRQLSEEWGRYKVEMQSAAAAQKQAATAAADGADRMSASQSRLLESLKRQSVQLTDGKAAWLEMRAAQLGVAQAADPYIQKIRAAERSTHDMNVAAKQTAWALRGVPAQFTDIWTSIAAGQNPMMVMIQQGGQLKDMFGGTGNAARALGGYVVGLINPFTLLAAAAGAVALAYYQGSKEADAYNRALIMTGNVAGTTAGQMAGMAERIGDVVGTQGKAAEALAAMAGTGRVAAGNLEYFSRVAVQMERTVGKSVEETAKEFAELGKAPVEASERLNQQYRYLTASVWEQIKALQEQGRAEEAAAVAQNAFADAMNGRTKQLEANLGHLESLWKAVADEAKKAWDAMLGVGRRGDVSKELADVASQIESHNPFAIFGPSLDDLKARQASLQELMRLTQRGAEITGEQQRMTQAQIAWDKEADQDKDKRAKRDQEMIAAAVKGRELINAGRLTEIQLSERLAAIADKYKETGKSGAAGTGQNEVAAIRAKVAATEEYLGRLREQGELADKMTEGERLVIKLQKELATDVHGVARAQKEKALAEAQHLVVAEKAVDVEKRRIKALQDARTELDKQIDAASKSADAIMERAIGQEAANEAMGKSKTAIEQATLALMRQQLVEADSSDRFDPAYVASLERKVAAEERYVKALQEAEFKQMSMRLAEESRSAGEETNTLNLQLSLLGRSQVERDKIIAQRRVELKLAKDLADIEKLNLGEGPEAAAKREELKAQAQANALVEKTNAANKVVIEEWERTSQQIEQSLTDALLRGFESGEDFAENFRNTLKNMFATLVLRPIIQPIAQGMSGLVLQAVGMGGGLGGVGGGASGIGNLFQMGSSAYNMYNTLGSSGVVSGSAAMSPFAMTSAPVYEGGQLVSAGGYGSTMGTYAAGLGTGLWAYNQTGSYTAGVAGGAAGMAGAGAIAGGMGAAAAGTSVGAGAMAGASAGLAAIPVWGWAALAVLAIAGDLMQDKKDPKVAFQMAKQGGGFDKNWEDGVKVSSVFGELGLNSNSKDVDAKDFRKSLESIAAFDSAMAAFLSAREIEAVRARMDGWKSTRVDAKYAAAGQRERMLAITEGIGGDVFADAQAFVDSGQAKGNKGVQAFTQFVLDRIRTDELSELVGGIGASLSDDAAMAWMQSLNRTETITNAKGKKEKVQISGFNEIAAATQQLQAVVGMDAGDALAAQVKAMVMQFDALGASMPTSIDGFKALIGGIDLTTEAGQKLYMQLAPLAAGFGQLQVAQQQLYDMLVPESEKLARAQTELAAKFADLGVAVPQGADTLRTLIDAQDQSTEAGRTMRAELLALVPAFKGVTDAAQEAGRAWEVLRADLTKFRNEITGGALAGLSPESAYLAAQTQFEQTSRLAAIGNQDALAQLSEVGRSFLDASREYFASGASYFSDLASVQGSVDAGLALTDRKLAAIAGGVDMPAFADGGFHAGGLRLVGEEGAEIEATGPARYWTAEQTRGFLSGDRSQEAASRDQEIIDELKVVVRVLSAGMSALDERLARLERSGNEQARQARMANDRRAA